ncbi:methylated-DNA--[protein]-cysteine S-methyltransferase [Ruegeria marisrubri]|uniref:methylated-DNA--[protein]-cysteine S-methyltransferase n=1 Tax=Ruegeria marisrubri TaxID=1685379 RepID=UPI001CD572EF|nr:methylated-DNA--[protein]-cysteine S-methyltransferase [Ruegeria marisrubri]MCA0907570.1 methylated-DNA--[protein]-cysteine S-methyltransferase [Ruegeria marisrubri]
MAMISVETQFGRFGVEETDGALTRLVWNGTDEGEPTALLREAAAQLRAYDQGRLDRFDLPYRIDGSEFQKRVCDLIYAIPRGETRTYGDIAKELGQPAQPVGQACGANPIPVIIPCHRVLAANGLGGFSGDGGVETKVALLRHERAAGLLI